MNKNKLVECPKCIGTGDEFWKGKHPRKCRTCLGKGVVDKVVADDFIENHLFDSIN